MSKIGDSISKRFDLLRGDVRKLQSDVELMKSDVSKLKVDVDNLKSTVDNLKSTVVHLGTSLETMVENMDGLAGEFKKFDEEQTVMSIVKAITQIVLKNSKPKYLAAQAPNPPVYLSN